MKEDLQIFAEVYSEELRQDEKWGAGRRMQCTDALAIYGFPEEQKIKNETDLAAEHHRLTWDHILLEELTEVHNARTWNHRRKELIQLAAVIFQEIKSNDAVVRELLRDRVDFNTVINEDKL